MDTNPSVAHAVVDLLPRRDSRPEFNWSSSGPAFPRMEWSRSCERPEDPDQWRVRTGDSIEGMRVVAIETDRVTIGMGDRLDDLLLASGSAREPLPRGVRTLAGIAVGNPSAALAGNQSRSINASATTIAKPDCRANRRVAMRRQVGVDVCCRHCVQRVPCRPRRPSPPVGRRQR